MKRSLVSSMTFVGAVAVGALLLVQPARAASIVINGDFETGDLTGWTDGGNTGWNAVSAGSGVGGSYGVDNGAVGGESLLSQTLTTVPGATYDLSIWDQQDGGGYVGVRWNGVAVIGPNFGGFSYTQFFATGLLATGTSTQLQIFSRDDPGFNQFDEIVVEQASSPVPEPASILLLGAGMVVLARRFRKKR